MLNVTLFESYKTKKRAVLEQDPWLFVEDAEDNYIFVTHIVKKITAYINFSDNNSFLVFPHHTSLTVYTHDILDFISQLTESIEILMSDVNDLEVSVVTHAILSGRVYDLFYEYFGEMQALRETISYLRSRVFCSDANGFSDIDLPNSHLRLRHSNIVSYI